MKINKTGLLILLLILILSSLNCSEDNIIEQKGNLTLNISTKSYKTILPNVDMNIAYYDITGTGPNNSTFSLYNISTSSTTIKNLDSGAWAISIFAKNSDGKVIASGNTAIAVNTSQTTSATVSVAPLNGTGNLILSLSWTSVLANPSITATITKPDGSTSSINFSISGNSASYSDSSLATGYYIINIQLKNDSKIIWGRAVGARIISAETTYESYIIETGTSSSSSQSPEILKIYTETQYQNSIQFPVNDFYFWSSSGTFYGGKTTTSTAEGTESQYIAISPTDIYWGMGIAATTTQDLSDFINGYIVFQLKADPAFNYALQIGIQLRKTTGETIDCVTDPRIHGFIADGTWKTVAIPISELTANIGDFDLSMVYLGFMIKKNMDYTGTGYINVFYDDIRWQKSYQPTSSSSSSSSSSTSPGTGNFQFYKDLNPVVSSSSIVLGDIENDGDLDLILTGAANNYSMGNNAFVTLQNDGTGSMNIIRQYITPGLYGSSVKTADIDNDGDLDLIATGSSSMLVGNTTVYKNNGNGSFQEYQNIVPNVVNSSISVGDIDGDGDIDLIISGYSASKNHLKAFVNDGSGNFTQHQEITPEGISCGSITLGDIDNDGDLDLIITGADDYVSSSRYFTIYKNNGSGIFTAFQNISPAIAYGSIALGDIDNDGDLDLVSTGKDASDIPHTLVHKNNGSGTFSSFQNITPGVYQSSIALGDLNGDGNLDLILTGNDINNNLHAKSFLNNGTGTFTENQNIGTGVKHSSIAIGDIDNDGDIDLIITGINGSTTISKIYKNE